MNVQHSELDPAVAELLKDYRVVVTTMVAWGEMDANRHVNNAVYFRYMEHARLRYFGELGFSRAEQDGAVGPILAWTDCRFRRPLSYPDTVSIGTRVVDIQRDRFTMHTVVVSHKLKEVAAEGDQRLVAYDYHQQQKATLPDAVRRRIEEFEKGN